MPQCVALGRLYGFERLDNVGMDVDVACSDAVRARS